MGLPTGLEFRTKGQLAIDLCAEVYADGLRFDRTEFGRSAYLPGRQRP